MRKLLCACLLLTGCGQTVPSSDGSAPESVRDTATASAQSEAAYYELQYQGVDSGTDAAFDVALEDRAATDAGIDAVNAIDAGSAQVDAASDNQTREASAARDAGVSALACPSGYGDCDRNPANGCEVNLKTDPSNCGICGGNCVPGGQYSRRTCISGQCIFFACFDDAGYANCDYDPYNGCEIHLLSSDNNCGACGIRCLNGQHCSLGTCH
jgi:hypothetical protein